MDKRYLLIIFIVLICSLNLYFISNSSDTIGSPSVSFGDYTFTIPADFNVMEMNDNYVSLNNPRSGLNVIVNHLSSKNAYDDYLSDYRNMENDDKINIMSKGSININNCSVSAVYYNVLDNNGQSNNNSLFFFKMYGGSFKITMNNFNYDDDREETINILNMIVTSIKINYKK